MLGWLRDLRRKAILEDPFPPAWSAILDRDLPLLRGMDAARRRRLEDMTQVFIAEKHWEGCAGLDLTDRIRVVIAGQACIMVLELDHDLYRRVESILVYPSTVFAPGGHARALDAPGVVIVDDEPSALLGEAHYRGPVILAWDAVREGAYHPHSGHNVVFHEFAHKLDMLDGTADGAPPLPDRERREAWSSAFSEAHEEQLRRRDAGSDVPFDDHALSHAAEFFAVATERFFEQPKKTKREWPAVYEVLAEYFRQDPAERDD